MYTVNNIRLVPKRVPPNSWRYNFIKSQPIFKIILPLEREGNFQ